MSTERPLHENGQGCACFRCFARSPAEEFVLQLDCGSHCPEECQAVTTTGNPSRAFAVLRVSSASGGRCRPPPGELAGGRRSLTCLSSERGGCAVRGATRRCADRRSAFPGLPAVTARETPVPLTGAGHHLELLDLCDLHSVPMRGGSESPGRQRSADRRLGDVHEHPGQPAGPLQQIHYPAPQCSALSSYQVRPQILDPGAARCRVSSRRP